MVTDEEDRLSTSDFTTQSPDNCVTEMRDSRSGDHAESGQLNFSGQVPEEADATAEQYWHLMDDHLVHQPGL